MYFVFVFIIGLMEVVLVSENGLIGYQQLSGHIIGTEPGVTNSSFVTEYQPCSD